MRKLPLSLALCLLIGCTIKPVDNTPDKPDDPRPANLYGLEGLAETVDAKDRPIAAALFAGAALSIRNDGELDEPKITESASVMRLFDEICEYRYDGHSPLTTDLMQRVGSVLNEKLQTDDEGREMTPDLRETAAGIFEAGAWALKQ